MRHIFTAKKKKKIKIVYTVHSIVNRLDMDMFGKRITEKKIDILN